VRLGSSYTIADEYTIEPFVIGGIWHEFGDENEAILKARGCRNLQPRGQSCGEVSAGANFFHISDCTSGFGKLDVAIGDFSSIGGQVGTRMRWKRTGLSP
jgi:outer membrane autotransporter protein